MKTILVWLLISVSDGYSYNQGNLTVVGKFNDVIQCEHVKNHLPNQSRISARCIQANIIQEN